MIGDSPSEEDWIRGQLRENVTPQFVVKPNSPTIVKRRYRESYFGVPLFAVDYLNDAPWSANHDLHLQHLLAELTDQQDLIVVSDFGHGMLSGETIRRLSDQESFLAVHPQANAANFGFHSISKYPRANYVCLAQREMEIERRERGQVRSEMLKALADRLEINTLCVTVGRAGCLCYDRERGSAAFPSLATQVRDRVGAGDTFFAFTALGAYLNYPLDQLAFLGNVAGAEAVSAVGHSHCLDEITFRRHVESLLK